jgi:hypothetical protein
LRRAREPLHDSYAGALLYFSQSGGKPVNLSYGTNAGLGVQVSPLQALIWLRKGLAAYAPLGRASAAPPQARPQKIGGKIRTTGMIEPAGKRSRTGPPWRYLKSPDSLSTMVGSVGDLPRGIELYGGYSAESG